MGKDSASVDCPKCGEWCFCEPAVTIEVTADVWDEFVEMVESRKPKSLPGLKRLMGRVVPWLAGNVSEAGSTSQDVDVQAVPCGTDEKLQAAPCSCGKYRFPTFELETLEYSWGPITDDDGVHEADRCLFGLREPSVQESGTHPSGIAVEIVGRSFDTIEVAPENVVQWDEQMFTLQVNWDDWCRIERGLDDAFDHTLNTSVDMERTENHELAEWFTTEADLCQELKHRLILDVEAQQ